jgi:protein involved in polysaccharide export with SLBB domain
MCHLRLTICDLGRTCRAGWLGLVGALALCLAGCSNKLLDPTQIGRFRPTPAVNVILDSLGVAEEAVAAWENAEEPRPKDIVAVKGDYMLRSGDLVRISIFELYQDGATVTNDYIVSETGKVSIPVVGVVQAAGLTETQLEEEIRQILSPNILKEPSITVTLLSSQQRTFSILGNGIPSPGRYPIPRYDFRLTDALAMAQGPNQFNVSYIYVSRPEDTRVVAPGVPGQEPLLEELELIMPQSSEGRLPSGPAASRPTGSATPARQREIPEPSEPAEKFELEREMLDLIAPSAKSPWPATEKVTGAPQVRTDAPRFAVDVPKMTDRVLAARREDVSASVMPQGFRLLVAPRPARASRPDPSQIVQSMAEFGDANEPQGAAAPAEAAGRLEWVYRDGKWIPVAVGPGPALPPTREKPLPVGEVLPMEEEWAEAIQTRLMKIPTDKLLGGDPRYNVIIKPGDTIHVPVDVIGEFWITGNVNRSGAVNMTGRPMNLKQAIAAAGGLGPLAYPKYCEVIRRIGDKKEEIVMVDLDKIASGEQPDFFIKPHDLINVGTHPTSRWRAVLRSAFRAAYGFAFVYDRNFADADYGDGFRLPSWL